MNQLVPIKVRIKKGTEVRGGKKQKKAVYPDFNQIDSSIRMGMPWSIYIDSYGSGWLRNNVRNIGTGAPEGEGMILIPKDFADEAVRLFPNDVTKLTDAEAQDFYDNYHAKEFPSEEINREMLEDIKRKKDLGQPLTTEQQKALDPADPTPGIRKNWKKKWADYKAKREVEIVQ